MSQKNTFCKMFFLYDFLFKIALMLIAVESFFANESLISLLKDGFKGMKVKIKVSFLLKMQDNTTTQYRLKKITNSLSSI